MVTDDNNISGGNVALLRILFLFSLFIPLETFAQNAAPSATEAAAAGAEATISNIPEVQAIASEATKFGEASAKVQAASTKLTEGVSSCETKKTAADYACLEKLSPGSVQFVAENGDLINMGLMIGSTLGEQCKGISDVLQKAGVALGLYQAACKVAQSMCTSSCLKVPADVTSVKSSTTAAMTFLDSKMKLACNPAVGVADAELCAAATANVATAKAATAAIEAQLTKIKVGTGDKKVVCGKYQISTQQAMMGAVSALKGMLQAKQCEDKNTSAAIAANQDCGNKASPGYASTSCQCARGEKSPAECQNINVGAIVKPNSIAMPNTGTTTSSKGSGLSGADLGGDTQSLGTSTAALSGAGAPIDGGGGGMGGGGSGQGGGLGQDGAGSARKINTNVLGGGCGGGGGGGGGSAGPGYGVDEKLKEYGPGGKNDPNRTVASQIAKEVTPLAGRTNWEKVKLRYRDNYSTLLNK